MNINKLTQDQKFAYEWQYRRLGGFDSTLADAISKADTHNQARFAKGFPMETLGIVSYQSVKGYWDGIINIMEGE